MVADLSNERDTLVGEAAADGRTDDDAAPRVRTVLAVLVPVVGVAKARVVGGHEPDHAVVAEADHLELLVREPVGIVGVGAVLAVEEVLGDAAGSTAASDFGLAADLGVAFHASGRVLLAPAGSGDERRVFGEGEEGGRGGEGMGREGSSD